MFNLRKIKGSILIFIGLLISFAILLGSYNSIKEGTFGIGAIGYIFIFVLLIIYLFRWGFNLLKSDEIEKAAILKDKRMRWHAFFGVSFIFIGLSLLWAFFKFLEFLDLSFLNKIYSLLPSLSFLILGIFWLYDPIKKRYYSSKFWKKKWNNVVYDLKKYKASSILGVLFLSYLFAIPFIFFNGFNSSEYVLIYVGYSNILFQSIWFAFFFFEDYI